ncbi:MULTISPECIES: peptidoglycan-binding protein [unclassified Streptomyces]|uniref:peptidoglycan-binding protein n=1 Tax=unclassified Streptomyces TaxID=2593676 RepID=UPI002E237889|nr:peptidoglycan-binding protein [Streptomyces sp. NBC_01023]
MPLRNFNNAEGTRMTVPVFEEYEPASDCGCAGCVEWRRSAFHTLSLREGGHPAAHGARRALVLATAAGVVLGGGTAAAASPDPGGQGQGPATAPVEHAKLPATTRSAIISRAAKWVAAKVPYRMDKNWKDGYRQDCSGFVSMAWGLDGNEWTGNLAQYGRRTKRSALRPGDILLFHNPANPNKGSHVTIFGGWTNSAHTSYLAYEQTRPHTRAQSTPYAYWSHSGRYVPYRYKGLRTGSGGSRPVTVYPGVRSFGKGAKNADVTRLGRMLVARGGGRFYRQGPGPRWGEADRRATQAFQRAQGWTGSDADGLPGRTTWSLLVKGGGKNIPAAGKHRTTGSSRTTTGTGGKGSPARTSSPARTNSPARTSSPAHSSSPAGTSSPTSASSPAGTSAPATPAGTPATPVGQARPSAPAGTKAPAGHASTGTPAGAKPPAGTKPPTGTKNPAGTKPPARPSTPAGHAGTPARTNTPARHPSAARAAAFPGAAFFRRGQSGPHVEQLGKQLVKKGFGTYYTAGPGPRWSEADRRNVQAFQRAQGWTGAAANGYPGPETWRRLFA